MITMSASSKKKLRNAELAEKLTEKQLAEQKEAKKLKLYTTLAVVILIALVLIAAYVGISRTIENSGIRERNTVALTIGEDYRTGSDGCITTEKAEHISTGFVTGFTSSTVTIDGTTYTLADSVKLISLDNGHKINRVNLGDLYMHHVEFVLDKGEVILILAGSVPAFKASGTGKEIVITADFSVNHFDPSSLAMKSLHKGTEAISTEGIAISITDNGEILVRAAENFAAGEYTLVFTLGGSQYTVTAAVAEAEQPEIPEQ
jgi:Tfp pilus assembly major pilin PilA